MELYDLCRLSDPTDAQVDQLAQLLEDKEHPDLNKPIASNEHNLTPLEILCWNNHSLKLERCIQLLIERQKRNHKKDYKHKRRSVRKEPITNKTRQLHGTGALFLICGSYSLDNLLDIVQLLIDQTHVDFDGNNYKLFPSMPPVFRELLCNYRWKTKLEPFERIVHLLIEKGADINSKLIESRWTALHHLAIFNQGENKVKIAEILMKNGINLNSKDSEGKNALILYIERRQRLPESFESIELTQLFIDHGIDINSRDNEGYNVLHRLLRHCCSDIPSKVEKLFKMLIENGIDVNATIMPNISYRYNNLKLNNALDLLFSCYKGLNRLGMLKVLIEHGLSIKKTKHRHRIFYGQKNITLFGVLSCTDAGNRADLVKLMIEKYELDVNAKNRKTGWNALHYLIHFRMCPDSVEVAKLLIEKGINVNAVDKNGNNGLHYILLNDHPIGRCRRFKIAKILFDNGINIWERNKAGHDCLDLISGYKCADCLEMYKLVLNKQLNKMGC